MIPHIDRWGNQGTEHSMIPHQRHMCEVAKQHLDVGSVAPHQPCYPRRLDVQSSAPDD